MLASTVLMLAAATAGRAASFCQSRVIRDYARPFQKLAEIPAIPFDQHLPFAPERVFLADFSTSDLAIGAGERGFSLSYSPQWVEGAAPSPPLNWIVSATLIRIDERGRKLAVEGKKAEWVETLAPYPIGDRTFKFPFSSEPALYRLEITFQDEHGGYLGRFGEYFRVLRPTMNFHLRLNRAEVSVGETLQATVENRGVAWLKFGLGRTIEFRSGNGWGPSPALAQGGVLDIGLGLGPGEATSCWKATIPAGIKPGLYRFVVPVRPFASEPFSLRTAPGEVRLASQFRINRRQPS